MYSNSFGIYNKSYSLILGAISEIPEIEKAIIFGSRAMGDYKMGSDIDIAIFGADLNFAITTRLQGKLNERLPIPYFVDVVHYETLNNEALKKHIADEGKVIFRRMETE